MRWLALVLLVAAACGDNTHPPLSAVDAPRGSVDAPITIDAPISVDAPVGLCTAPCDLGHACALDSDCISAACDSMTHTCVADRCADHHRDGVEADVDCGDGICPGCTTGQQCAQDAQCAQHACDALAETCVLGGSCHDHAIDGQESDVDCGGIDCTPCYAGRHCDSNFDCAVETTCNANHQCEGFTCENHAQDAPESDVDCGGGPLGCTPCAVGKHCNVAADCTSNTCNAQTHVCVSSTIACTDGLRDGDESAADCGGATCPACGVGLACAADADCTSHACDQISHACAIDGCHDHHRDGVETATDCGGGTCAGCPLGAVCAADGDCANGAACDGASAGPSPICVAPACVDHALDGTETAIDCGGTCAPCGLGLACAVDQDCASGACDALSHTCVADRCVDHHQELDEGDVDCGGSSCAGCALGQACRNGADCASTTCDQNHTCHVPWCLDGALDQNETDVDCGGGQCARCELGQHCGWDLDCASRACDAISRMCVADPCFDHQWDNDEAYTDCGGPTCAKRCAVGDGCNDTSDCEPGHTCLAHTVCQ